MPFIVESSWSLQKVLISLAFATFAAGIFSVVVLHRDMSLEKELLEVRLERQKLAASLEELKGVSQTTQSTKAGDEGNSAMDTERERKLMEELEHERQRAADREAELHAEQKERASRDLELAEERRRAMYLQDELEAAQRDRAELAQAAAEARKVGDLAEKLAASLEELKGVSQTIRSKKAGEEGNSNMDTERERKLKEELEHERQRAADRDAELHAEQKRRASRDLELAEERRRAMYLEDELEAARRDRAKLSETAVEARKVGKLAGKVAGGVILCTVLWDASFFIGNPFAVPGITDNLVCGGIASALGMWRHSKEQDQHTQFQFEDWDRAGGRH